jgi:hypothetical protein
LDSHTAGAPYYIEIAMGEDTFGDAAADRG